MKNILTEKMGQKMENKSNYVVKAKSIRDCAGLPDAFVERALCVCKIHERKVTEYR